MIGTGVFTSLGFQLLDIQSTFPLLLLWVVGGAAAFCGAISYAELGAAIPRSGGEYTFLSRVYHPAAGFVSGFVSATVGFSAPTALAAITFGTYLASVFPSISPTLLGAGLVAVMAAVHVTNHRSSGLLQSGFTTLKVALIVAFCLAAAALADPAQPIALTPAPGDCTLVFGGAFAVSLIYVSYAYTGWNAATYLTGEVDDPQRTIPRILASGTLLVTVLYVALNYAFLRAAPMAELEGRLEVGYVAATHLFGPAGAAIMGVTLAVLLVSTVSAMVLAGPRVLQVMGEDHPALRRLARTKPNGIPAVAVLAQAALTLAFIVTASLRDDPGLRGVHPRAEQPAHRGGRLRPADARTVAGAALPDVGVPVHAPGLPRADLVDARLHRDRSPHGGTGGGRVDRRRTPALPAGPLRSLPAVSPSPARRVTRLGGSPTRPPAARSRR